MASSNYIVKTERMTLTDEKEYRMKALAAGLERCTHKSIGNLHEDIDGLQSIPDADKAKRVQRIYDYIKNGAWPSSIDQRELAPLTDLVVPTALDQWNTAALAAVGGAVSCFQAVAVPQLVVGKLAVFYAVSIETVPNPVSRLIFRRGGAAGNIQAQFDLEPIGVGQMMEAYLSEPVVVDPQELFAVQVLCRIATGVLARVHVHNFLFENAGDVIA